LARQSDVDSFWNELSPPTRGDTSAAIKSYETGLVGRVFRPGAPQLVDKPVHGVQLKAQATCRLH
jgi:hypothetical protein